MIKDFLQFIKKTILVARLSRQGLFSPLSKMKTFRFAKFPAQFFASQNTGADSFFKSNSLFLSMTEELLSSAPLCGFPFYFLPCFETKEYQNKVAISCDAKNFDWSFYNNLFQEICSKDFSSIKGLYASWQRTQHIQTDMRLYGANLEEINNTLIYEIDWIRTTQTKLEINFKEKAYLTDKLSKPAQKNLASYFADLFFTKKILVEAWRGVLCSKKNQISFLPILNIQRLELEDLNFAIRYLQQNIKPQTIKQCKISYAFELLKHYCPDISLSKQLDSYLHLHILKKASDQQALLSTLNKHGMVYLSKPQLNLPKAKNLTYLLDSKRHKKDKNYKKSSSLYILLLLLAYLLLQYF